MKEANKELVAFRQEQKIKGHARNAKWHIERTRLQGFAMDSQNRKIIEFCKEYFEKHQKLPTGKCFIAHTDVEFPELAK